MIESMRKNVIRSFCAIFSFGGFYCMKYLLQSIPIPISGVMLAFISLGNLLHSIDYHTVGHISFFIGVVLFLLLIGKLIFATQSVVTEMQNPIIASVSPTFTMGTLSLSSGLHYYGVSENIIQTIWILAAVTQFFIIFYFVKNFIWKNKIALTNVFPSWLILFVGTAVMPLTAGSLSGKFTQGILVFAFCAFLIIAPIVILRGFIRKDLPEPTIPMVTILTAPASLILVAYFEQFTSHVAIVMTLFIIAQLLFVLVLIKLTTSLQLPFYPSYAAFTFPLVITATATNTVIHYLEAQNISSQWFNAYFIVQLLFASSIVVYVTVRYISYLSVQVQAKRRQALDKEQTIS